MKSRQEPPLLRRKLKGYGYRITQGREAVMNVLAGEKDHLSAEDIYIKVHPAYPAIGLTSVYRTLEVLVSTGLVYKFDFGDGRARYEIAESHRGEAHHHHLVCAGCSRIVDYVDFVDEELALLKKTEAELSKKYNFTITNHLIQFYGFCNKCKAKKKEK
ncbi:MAG TPA: transcriptional repressor [Syntrophales bacterium]|nr:transcriptional repressor [Syntrophales bacterium]